MKKKFPWRVYLVTALVAIVVAALILCCSDLGDYVIKSL